MTIHVVENEGCFGLELTAEDMVEASLLTRMGANATKEIRHFSTSAHTNGAFSTAIVFGKDQRGIGEVPNRNRRSK